MEARFKPPKEFFRYLKREYAYKRYGNESIVLSQELQSGLLCAAYGATAWLRSKNGANWCFALCGVEEVEPHYAFEYFYVPPQGEKRKLQSDVILRIFRERKKKPVEILKSSVDIARKVVYTEGWDVPSEDMLQAAISAYREWIQKDSGFEWVKSLFRPILEIDVHNGIAYKCTSQDQQAYWFGERQIASKPKPSVLCLNCDLPYPCTTNLKGMGDLCNRCYGENFGEIDVLTLCNRHECAEICCENHMSEGKLEDTMFGKYGAIP